MNNLIKTDRLLLKPICEDDISFIQKLISHPETFFYDRDMQKTQDDVEKECKWYIEKEKALPNEGGIRWVVKLNSDSIGEIHVQCNWEKTLEWEIGYNFLKEYWGKGYAIEALKIIIPHIFNSFKVNRLVAFTNANNKESVALLKRVGMIEEARLREVRMSEGIYCDEMVFSLLKRDIR